MAGFIWGNAGGGGCGWRLRLGTTPRNGTPFPLGALSGNCPSLMPQNGTRFPLEGRSGNGIPVLILRMGCTFRMVPQAETVSQNPASEWDTVSGWHHLRKRCPISILQNEKKSWSCASLRGFPALVKQTYRMRCAASRKLPDDLGAAGRLASNLIRRVVFHATRRV